MSSEPAGRHPARAGSARFPLPLPPAIAPTASLHAHLRQWILDAASEEACDRFLPLVEKALRARGFSPDAPASEKRARRAQEALRRADITPARMERALREARRAAEADQSTLEWIRSLQARAYGEALAEKARKLARARLERERRAEDLQEPPSPEETFAFLLSWAELGGSSELAALRELQRRENKGLPTN